MRSPTVRRQVETAKAAYTDARKVIDERLEAIEADLWAWIQTIQAETQKTARQMQRRADSSAHYKVLGVHRSAKLPEIKAAFREKMRAHHPDRFANDPAAEARAHARAQEINHAYQELRTLLTGREDRRAF